MGREPYIAWRRRMTLRALCAQEEVGDQIAESAGLKVVQRLTTWPKQSNFSLRIHAIKGGQPWGQISKARTVDEFERPVLN